MDARELEDGDGQSAAAEDLDTAVAGLYRLPLAEFVAACDRLVRQLRPLATARPPVAWLWRAITGWPKGLSA